MKFSELLGQRLSELDISLSDFSTRLTLRGYPVTKSAVALWATDRRMPKLMNPQYRYAIASSLEIDVNEMMNTLGYIIKDEMRSPEAIYIADIVDHLSPDKRKLAVNIVEQIAKE